MTSRPLPALTGDDAAFDLEQCCRAGQVTAQWVIERVQAGLLEVHDDTPGAWRFDAYALRRVRRIAHLERHFDAVPELAALVADLQEEIERLRARRF